MIVEEGPISQLILIVANGLLAIVGFVGAFMIQRLTRSIDTLTAADRKMEDRILNHREDVLKNYVSHTQLESLKHDVILRIDKLEEILLEVLKHTRSKH